MAESPTPETVVTPESSLSPEAPVETEKEIAARLRSETGEISEQTDQLLRGTANENSTEDLDSPARFVGMDAYLPTR